MIFLGLKMSTPSSKTLHLLIRNSRFVNYIPHSYGENYVLEFNEHIEIFSTFSNRKYVIKRLNELTRFFSKFDIIFFEFIHKPLLYSDGLAYIIRGLYSSEVPKCYIENETDTKNIYDSALYPNILQISDFIQTNIEYNNFDFRIPENIERTYNLIQFDNALDKSLNCQKDNKIVEFGSYSKINGHNNIPKLLRYIFNENLEFSHYNMRPNNYVKENYIKKIYSDLGNKDLAKNINFPTSLNILDEMISSKYSTSFITNEVKRYDYKFLMKTLFTIPIIEHSMFSNFKGLPYKVTRGFLKYDIHEPAKVCKVIVNRIQELNEDNDLYSKTRENLISYFTTSINKKYNEINTKIIKDHTNLIKYDHETYIKQKKLIYFNDYKISYTNFLNNVKEIK